jgi:monoamine oxidase
MASAKAAQPKVVIVGGGIAGLSCALKLADRGYTSTIYEASARAGGRMFSNTTGYWADGQISEWGGELIDTGHKTIRKLAQRFDLSLDDLLAAQPAGSEETYYVFGAHYPKAQADLDFAAVYAAASADLTAAGYPTRYDAFTNAGALLDAMSAYDWIETRVPGGHASPLGAVLDIAYAIEYGAETTDQSALNLLYLLAYQPKPLAFSSFGESDERFHIRGGNQQLPEAMAQHLGNVVYGEKLVSVVQTPAGRYDLVFQSGTGTTRVTTDYVVLALPFAVLRDIDTSQAGFSALKNLAIQELGMGRNGKLQLQFTSRLWNQPGVWGLSGGSTYADTGYQASWDVTRAQSGASGIHNLYSGGSVTLAMQSTKAFATVANAGVAADAAQGLMQIEPVFPGISALWNGLATESLPHLSPLFKASYAYYRVAQYTSFGGNEGEREGNVLFCGEHTSQDFQGFMEGGAETGEKAGKALAHELP